MTRPALTEKRKTDKNGWIDASLCPVQRNFPVMIFTTSGNQHVARWVQDFVTGHEGMSLGDMSDGQRVVIGMEHVTHWQPCLPIPVQPRRANAANGE